MRRLRAAAIGPLLLAELLVGAARVAESATSSLFEASPFRESVAEAHRAIHTGSDTSAGNRVLILDSGDDALLARAHLIRNATRSIEIQTFIWSNDEVGRFLMCELIQAARRGVKVRIIVDHFVSYKDPEITAFLATAHPNLELKHYRPTADMIQPAKHQVILNTITRFRDINQRMHNKIMAFDGVVAITGGRNIENTYYNRSTGMTFKDRDVLVVGPVVPQMVKSFDRFWGYKHSVPSDRLKDVAGVLERGTFKRYDRPADFDTGGICDDVGRDADSAEIVRRRLMDGMVPARCVSFLSDKPGKNRSLWLRGSSTMTDALRKIMESARSDILIQSPYFVLSSSTRRLLKHMRRDSPSLRVTICTNSFGSTDNTVAYSACYKLRSVYLEELDLNIHEYKPLPGDLLRVWPAYPEFLRKAKQAKNKDPDARLPFLCIHAKSFVIDNRLAFIGSYNLDPRSQNLNTEVGLLIEDAKVARLLRDEIKRDTNRDNSWVIAKNPMPLALDKINALVEGTMRLSPIDVWPIRNSSSFELIPGREPVPPGHPDFYSNHRNMGSFPGADDGISKKEIMTRIYKAVGGAAVPLL